MRWNPPAVRTGTALVSDGTAISLSLVGAGSDTSTIDATPGVLATLSSMVSRGSRNEHLRLTADLTDGQDLDAFRYAVNDSANSLYYRSVSGGRVIRQEPLDREHSN